MGDQPVDETVRNQVRDFLYREARLMDEHRFEEWESLWSDDGVYWVPADEEDYDPDTRVSIIYDDRRLIASRVERLATGLAYSQQPPTQLRRIVSNIEVAAAVSGRDDEVVARHNFFILAARRGITDQWAGKAEHILRRRDDGWRIASKKVVLINNDQPLGNLTFLI